MNVGNYQNMQNYNASLTPEEVISSRIRDIDAELARFSEEARKKLLSERARLLRAQEALAGK